MKKFIIIGGILALASVAFIGQASACGVERDYCNKWDVKGTYVIDFTLDMGGGVYTHTMNVTAMNLATGNFSGNGFYNADPSYTWTVTGNVTDSNIAFHIVYTGTGAGYTVDATGTIASGGTLSGIGTDSNNLTFTWKSTSGQAEKLSCENHGQYVRDHENKREGAHSRFGMPEQSRGHEDDGHGKDN